MSYYTLVCVLSFFGLTLELLVCKHYDARAFLYRFGSVWRFGWEQERQV